MRNVLKLMEISFCILVSIALNAQERSGDICVNVKWSGIPRKNKEFQKNFSR